MASMWEGAGEWNVERVMPSEKAGKIHGPICQARGLQHNGLTCRFL